MFIIDSGDQFIPASNNSCACPNRILTYTCTVVGGGSTVWTGSGFSCSGNEIVLLHTEYADRMAVGMCNNGAIIGQGLSVNGNRYTSELRVNASSGLNNTAVRCLNAGLATVGEASINVISRAHGELLHAIRVSSSGGGKLPLQSTQLPPPPPTTTWQKLHATEISYVKWQI